MNKPKVNLKYKKELEAAKERGYLRSLKVAKYHEKRMDIGKRKRKELEVLLKFLNLPSRRHQIRPEEDYRPKSYNLGRQVIGLIDHLFGIYPAPAFLYQPVLHERGLMLVYGWSTVEYTLKERKLHSEWLLTVLKGESIAKKLKGVLTKKEAHWFLKAPEQNTVNQNLFWAKCAAAGIPETMCQFLTEHLWSPENERLMGDRLPDILRFYATFQSNLRGYALRNITDFVRDVIRNRSFSFKGRTYGSMAKLSYDWHRTGFNGAVEHRQNWRPLFTSLWEIEMFGLNVRAIELTNNRMLGEEGRKQRHCVFTYTHGCVQGYERIVSMRFSGPCREVSRLTIEIWPKSKTVVQVRGFANREPTEEEMKVVRRWAGDHGLTLDLD